jgi:hypothetical protein
MAKVKEVISWLSERDPEEVIALTGWWYKSDVESNNELVLTDDQWQFITDRHEENTEVDISSFVLEALEQEN